MELEKIKESLSIVQHPEFKKDIVSLGMVELQQADEKVIVTVTFQRLRTLSPKPLNATLSTPF